MRMRLWASAVVLCACSTSSTGTPPDGDGGTSACTVTVSGDLMGANLKCTKGVSPFGAGEEQVSLTVAGNATQPVLFSLVCIEPSPLVPGTYGPRSPTTQLGCTAVVSELQKDGAAGYDFLPRPSAGATVEATLTSVTPLHGTAKGTLIESFFDGGTGRTVTFTAAF
jgi:hypothetical protein